MSFTVTTLIENLTSSPEYETGHGLSLFLTDGRRKILFDTGPDQTFLRNAERLRISLERIDALVLSHGHYDHAGGVPALFESGARPGTCFIGPTFFEPRYQIGAPHRHLPEERKSAADAAPAELLCRDSKDYMHYIGTNFSEYDFYRMFGKFCIPTDPALEIFSGVWLLSAVARTCPFEKPFPGMRRKVGREYVVDDFRDELSLVIETRNGLVLISGCSHAGVVNLCEAVRARFGCPPSAFLGGTHLMSADDERISRTLRYFRENGIARLGACHCNGERAAAIFESEYPGFFRNTTGMTVQFD